MTDDRYKKSLIVGMVGEEHKALYQTSPDFRAAIEATAEHVIPALVEGYAQEATRRHWQREDDYEKIMKSVNEITIPEEWLEE